MDPMNTGAIISDLRKKAGYTQKELAKALLVTDKAVSKWERGICLPDSSLLSKIAGLLDTDIGTLIPDGYKNSSWNGLLILDDFNTVLSATVNNKPLLEYLFSYFMLLGITDITLLGKNREQVRTLHPEQYGITLRFDQPSAEKTMVIYGGFLLFGAYLSHQMINMMMAEENIIPIVDNIEVPILFAHGRIDDLDQMIYTAKRRSLYRGIVYIDCMDNENRQDAETLIRIYEKHHHIHFSDLKEIAESRELPL